jgi:hypothetical protein
LTWYSPQEVSRGKWSKSRQAKPDVEVVQSEQLQTKSIAGAGLAAKPTSTERQAIPNSFLIMDTFSS